MNPGHARARVGDRTRPSSTNPTLIPITGQSAVVRGLADRRTAGEAHTPRRLVVAGRPATIIEALAVALNAQGDFEVIGVANTEDGMPLRVVDGQQPHAAVVYTPQFGPEVLDATARLKSLDARVRVILLLTDRPSLHVLSQAAEAEVAACLPVDTGLSALIGAIRADTTDSVIVGASLLARGDRVPDDDPSTASPRVTLTPRELEVLALMAEGCNPPAIAVRLVVSIYTARGHVKNVLRKLDAHSQLEAVAIASRMALLEGAQAPGLGGSGLGPTGREVATKERRVLLQP